MRPKSTSNKRIKVDTLNYIKVKSFCAANTAQNISGKWTDNIQNGIFPNHIPNKGLVPRVYKDFLQINNKKLNYPIKN